MEQLQLHVCLGSKPLCLVCLATSVLHEPSVPPSAPAQVVAVEQLPARLPSWQLEV